MRFGGTAQAGQQKVAEGERKNTSQAAPNADVWNVDGVIVDEQGRPVAGANVRTMPVFGGTANVEQKCDPDGKFRFTLSSSSMGLVGLMAEADDGVHMGLDRSFDRRRFQRITEPARIVLKPSRPLLVRVKDGGGAPVPGATVEAAETSFRTHAETGRTVRRSSEFPRTPSSST